MVNNGKRETFVRFTDYGGYGCWPVGAASTIGWFSPSRLVCDCGAGAYANVSYGVGTGIIAIAILILIALGVIF